MAKYVLGVSAFYHDSAAALLYDGTIVAAAQEERFTRRKADEAFPANAIAYCLKQCGIGPERVDQLIYYEKPQVKYERLMETYRAYGHRAWPSFQQAFPQWACHRLNLSEVLRAGVGDGFTGDLLFADHHESHAASAFYPSPFDSAAILTMDAVGEWATSSIGVGNGNRIELLQEMRFPHSLGMLYSAFTYYTGFKVNSGEYKLMGLAPYGEPIYTDLILEHVAHLHQDGSIALDLSYFNYCEGLTMTSERFNALFGGPPRSPESLITKRERDMAASIQKVTEEAVLRMARHTRQVTGMKRLVLSGGVALNCVANGRLLREGPFDELWVQPASGDAGGALGAAYLAWHQFGGQPRVVTLPDAQHGSWLGPAYSTSDIELLLSAKSAVWERFADEAALLDFVARRIDEGQVVGWFHGRMEFGPRALGARSIIGDARSAEMQSKMNLKIKFRESFRPFAPCVLREHASDVFQTRPEDESPYMLMVAPIREELRLPLSEEQQTLLQDDDLCVRASVPRSTYPAVTHVDYSARIQTIDAQRHGRFHRLMKRLYELTGCPVVVNTSFNIRGEPIVCSPEDAFRCFMATDMDCLVLEDLVLLKRDQTVEIEELDEYKDRYAPD
jgi:carbamoyltransferase